MAERKQLLNDQEEALRVALDGRLSSVWTAIPGEVTEVDFSTMTCSIQPTIQGVVTSEDGTRTPVNLPVLINCPIVHQKAGGVALTLPLVAGDEVLVVFASRCIDAWWQSGGIQRPIEYRMHDISDGFAIVGVSSVPNVIENISNDSAQLRTLDGTSYIELKNSGEINLVSPVGINITGNVVVTGEVTANGVDLSTHTHSGVQTGGGNSGPPNP